MAWSFKITKEKRKPFTAWGASKTLFRWSYKLVFAALLLLCAGIFFSLPKQSGEYALKNKGLTAEVIIKRDDKGVPHIEAQSINDLAFAVGFTHAQDRLWQLEFNRRVMNGQLSEVLGDATLPTDKFIRTIGVKRAAISQFNALPAENKKQIESYVAGINAYLDEGVIINPPEFWLTGAKPQKWDAADSVGWNIMMALDLGGNYAGEAFRMSLARDFDFARVKELSAIANDYSKLDIKDFAQIYKDIGLFKKQTALNLEPQPFAHGLDGIGSNNWVAAGSRTKSGKPLLANDPHLGLTAPAVWYFAHLRTPQFEAIGATFPGGFPVVLGRNNHIAWGFTNTGPDVQDLYIERINAANPKEYQTPNGFAEFKTRKEIIKVKNKPDVEIEVRETRHGAIVTDVVAGVNQLIDTSKYAISLQWTALREDNSSALVGLKMNQAQNVQEAREALRSFTAPQQNVVIADKQGNISLVSAGLVPIRAPDSDFKGYAPALGWEARNDWQGFVPFDELPQTHNPANGFIATANSRIHSEDYKHHHTYDWTADYRYKRIMELEAKSPKHDAGSFTTMLSDVTSLAAAKLNPHFQKALTSSKHALAEKARAKSGNFSGVMDAGQAAPLIFSSFIDQLTQDIVVSKLGARATIYGTRDFRIPLEGILERDDKFYCEKSCAERAAIAIDKALDDLSRRYGVDLDKWLWGEAHKAVSEHNPMSKVGALARFFNVTTPTGGDTYTVNVGRLQLGNRAAPFTNRHAASLRAIYDLEDLEKSQFIYQTGQSGNPFSLHYRDMSEKWGKVEFLPLTMKPTSSLQTLTLKPN